METTMPTPQLPDGEYPFADARYPLSEMAMMEAPLDLERLLKEAARENGTTIVRDVPVELICRAPGFPSAAFLAWLPSDGERLHILAPKNHVRGRA